MKRLATALCAALPLAAVAAPAPGVGMRRRRATVPRSGVSSSRARSIPLPCTRSAIRPRPTSRPVSGEPTSITTSSSRTSPAPPDSCRDTADEAT